MRRKKIEIIRDELLNDNEYRSRREDIFKAYSDGVLDFYNKIKEDK